MDTRTDKTKVPEKVDAHFADRRFSQKIRCTRSGLDISFGEFGDTDGLAVLLIPPIAASRWYIAPQDQYCSAKGIRLICVDRPGFGGTPNVPSEKRIEVSCQMILSVLEHLNTRPRHLIAASSGIYYAMHLLATYSDFFPIPPQPILISPWVPSIGNSSAVGHKPALENPMYGRLQDMRFDAPPLRASGGEPVQGRVSWKQRLFGKISPPTQELEESDRRGDSEYAWKIAAVEATLQCYEVEGTGHQGIEDEQSICNGPSSVLIDAFSQIASRCHRGDWSMIVTIWWGPTDQLVPAQSQKSLVRLLDQSKGLSTKVYTVKDAGHTDLLWRDDGLGQAFAMMHFRERVYYGA